MKRVDAQLDHMEQYNRRSSVRVTGIKEHNGEDLDRIVTNLIDHMKTAFNETNYKIYKHKLT